MLNQISLVFGHLQVFGSLTSMQAIRKFGILRLASRIHEIKKIKFVKRRYKIVTLMISDNGKRYAKYVLRKRN